MLIIVLLVSTLAIVISPLFLFFKPQEESNSKGKNAGNDSLDTESPFYKDLMQLVDWMNTGQNITKLSFQAEREPGANSGMFFKTRELIVSSGVSESAILDSDLAWVPEVYLLFFEMAAELRDHLYKYHQQIDKSLQFPIIQNCFSYCYTKGAEMAFVWYRNPPRQIPLLLNPVHALNNTFELRQCVGADDVELISTQIVNIQNVFVDFQNKMLMTSFRENQSDTRYMADLIACGLFWAAAIGLDFGMNLLGMR